MGKLTLTERFGESIELRGNKYPLDFSFDNVLRVFELFEDDDFKSYEKIEIAFDMFVLGDFENIDLKFEEKDLTIYNIFKEYLEIDLAAKQNPNTNKERYFDLYEDSERIYAAFIKEYNIDLFEQQGKMHFIKFKTLIGEILDRDLKDIVSIRAQEMPKHTKYNADERKQISKLKKIYKLKNIQEDPEVLAQQIDNAFDEVANFFKP